MPSGKPGKFSTSVVFISAPPYWLPSNTSGARSARAVYSAAVYPAGPDPMMMTLRCWLTVRFASRLLASNCRQAG